MEEVAEFSDRSDRVCEGKKESRVTACAMRTGVALDYDGEAGGKARILLGRRRAFGAPRSCLGNDLCVFFFTFT